MGSVGDARSFLSAHCNLPRWRVAHYVAVVAAPDWDLAAISTCCDGVGDAQRMLRGALTALTRQVQLDPESDAVIVARADLKAAIAGALDDDARKRLAEALGDQQGEPGCHG